MEAEKERERLHTNSASREREAIEELYRDGMLFKDKSGEPLLRKGQQAYKAIDFATSAERAFWNKEKQGHLKSQANPAVSHS